MMRSIGRTQPAVCVTQPMDPIGFSLENYDAVGKWRTHVRW